MKQQQTQRPDTSRQPRYLVTFMLVLAVGATLWILKSQGVFSTAWLAALPWIGVGLFSVLIGWAVLWLLHDRGILRGSWFVGVLPVIRRLGPRVILLAGLFFFLAATVVEIIITLNKVQGQWWDVANLAVLIQNALFPGFGFLLTFLQVYLIFQPPQPLEPHIRSGSDLAPASQSPSPIIQVIVPPSSSVSFPPTPPGLTPTPVRNLISIPVLTEFRFIEQREVLVRDIYQRLIDQNITALVLTGIGGAGKSTLAALVHRYEERQRQAGTSLFAAKPLWLTIDATVTMAELAATLLEAFGKPVPHVESLPSQQALALFNALSDTDAPRLIVLDQFESLLNPSTGQLLPENLGFTELLEAFNSHPSQCRMVLTSRLWPRGTREYVPARMQEYFVDRLTTAEGVELLRKQGVASTQATEAELRIAVERFQGHPLSLTLLASLLRTNQSLHLRALLTDTLYAQLWKGKIAVGLLDYIYKHQLNDIQRKLLCAFSVYREAVPLDAVQALMTASPQEVLKAWEVLCAQHLLQDVGELRYQLHAIVGEYAIDHFDEHNDGANRQALQEAHTRAAAYYVQMARNCPPREKRRNVKDVLPLIEGIWQFCQAGRWKEAYDLMNQEEIFDDVSRWGGNVLLLELCLMFLPVDKWHPERSDEALIYSRIAYIDGALGKKTEALGYFEQALTIRREVGNRFGEGITLHNIGVISFQRERYDVALACFWLAGILYVEVQSPSDVEDEEQMIGAVHQKVGEQQFAKLLAEVQAKATEIVEQALRDEFEC